jgi:ABC-type cobalamin transport system ATPase subunit
VADEGDSLKHEVQYGEMHFVPKDQTPDRRQGFSFNYQRIRRYPFIGNGRSAILVLDEATSVLDAPTERALLSSIVDVSGNRTLIVISHRLSSIAWGNRFVLLDRGRIIESGNHEHLYAQSPLYRSLFDASVEDTMDVTESKT